MRKKFIFCILVLAGMGNSLAQHSVSLNAILNDSLRTVQIQQELVYRNTSSDTLKEIRLYDWNNAFSNKSTPLAKRFSEDYIRRFHFAQEEERGSTTIHSVSNKESDSLYWHRPEGAPDIIKIELDTLLFPGETYTTNIIYTLKIPSEQFTRYGHVNNGNYRLRYWFLTPGTYENGWEMYSHKNLDDPFIPKLDLDLLIQIPDYLTAVSALELESIEMEGDSKIVHLMGKDRLDTRLYLTRNYFFENIETENVDIITNMDDEGLAPPMKNLLVNRIVGFLNERLGSYPHPEILSTKEDYLSNPMYGLNQLPKFIRPFPEGFNYDLKQLKTITENYLENSLLLNPRTEQWIYDAIQIYLMMEYVEENYPEMKVIGNLSEVIGIRWFHVADLKFNDQYALLYMLMARNNMDQALTAPQDSLVKFNETIANAYKAGVGFKYLEHFLSNDVVSETIKDFFSSYRLEEADPQDFQKILKENAEKDIEWFFKDYVGSDEKIDFRIKRVKKLGDSLKVTIKNKTGNGMPITLYGLNDGEIIYKTWVEDIEKTKSVVVPSGGVERLALNYEGHIPEVNQRDNYEGVSTLLDKPIQFRLLKDVEDPRYTQVFFMPRFNYNLYDGLSLGLSMYNETILSKNFEYEITPLYAFKSQTIVGGASFSHRIQFEDQSLYSIRYGASGSRFSYGYGRFYEKFTPFLLLSFREQNLRNNEKQYLTIRNVNVYRDQNFLKPFDAPDYSVFNINYRYSDPGMVDYLTANIDFQLSQHFSKFSVTAEYRQLFKNNRQINLRFFAGTFLYNDLTGSNYFSFALDRPTDYLYDYNYYGRSETSGLFSQQIIMAEGGFKSQLQPEFANQWLTTVNGSTNIWKWIYAYGDLGLVKNKDRKAKFVYDSGIRLSIVADYFEIYFPVYSNLGWEIDQENYDERIRFIATLDLKTLLGIFSREWY